MTFLISFRCLCNKEYFSLHQKGFVCRSVIPFLFFSIFLSLSFSSDVCVSLFLSVSPSLGSVPKVMMITNQLSYFDWKRTIISRKPHEKYICQSYPKSSPNGHLWCKPMSSYVKCCPSSRIPPSISLKWLEFFGRRSRSIIPLPAE